MLSRAARRPLYLFLYISACYIKWNLNLLRLRPLTLPSHLIFFTRSSPYSFRPGRLCRLLYSKFTYISQRPRKVPLQSLWLQCTHTDLRSWYYDSLDTRIEFMIVYNGRNTCSSRINRYTS